MKPGDVARVIRDFLTTQEEELSVTRGDYVQVINVLDRHWALCRHHHRQGQVPTSHVTPEDVGTLPEGTRLFVANTDFRAEQNGDMDLTKGTLVFGYEQVDEHWMRGSTLTGGQGLFPPSYCWELEATNYVPSKAREKHLVEKYAQVIQSLRAQLAEEIDLEKGDIVKIVEIVDKDWYRGEAKGRIGIFPSSFVKIVDAFPGDAPAPDANVKPYVDAGQHKGNEYMNTRNTFDVMERGLKSMGQHSMMHSVMNGLEIKGNALNTPNPFAKSNPATSDTNSHGNKLAEVLMQDDYFKQNLPSSYGSVSLTPPDEEVYNVEQSVFGGNVARCSQGFLEMSHHLKGMVARGGMAGPSSTRQLSPERKLINKPDYNKVLENLTKSTHGGQTNFRQTLALEEAERQRESMSSYNKLTENLKVFDKSSEQSQGPMKRARAPDPVDCDQDNHLWQMSSNLAFGNEVPKKAKGTTRTNASHQDEGFRYQNIKCESVGYTVQAVQVKPYAITKFNFMAEFESELGFSAGEMVYLHRYVDNEWLEGEIDNQTGLFPIHYVNIIVDVNQSDLPETCQTNTMSGGKDPTAGSSELFKSTAVTVHENLKADSFHRVLYNFHAQMDGDITVAEDEVVRIKEKQSKDWVVVENSAGEVGVMPGNHLDPNPEFDGRAQFDIDRLINYRLNKDYHSLVDNAPHKTAPNPALKFFDPLCSPDSEMIKIEEELERKSREPIAAKLLEQRAKRLSSANALRSTAQTPRQEPKAPKDLDTLIHNNLTKLRSDSPNPSRMSTGSQDPRTKIEISRLVLDELRGKNYYRSAGDTENDVAKTMLRSDSVQSSESEVADSLPPPAYTPPPKIPAKGSKKRPAPPKPNKPPSHMKALQQSAIMKPEPSVPVLNEPLYTQINKLNRSVSVSKGQVAPERPPRPKLKHNLSLPAPARADDPPEGLTRDEPLATDGRNRMTIQADVHSTVSYDTPHEDGDHHYDQTPTNEKEKPNNLPGPHVPLRSSSIPSKPPLDCRRDASRSIVHVRDLDLPVFPPDKSQLSPSSGEHPPKVGSLPCRTGSMGVGSMKARNGVYHSIYLNHSYETLNMSDCGSNDVSLSRRRPHRPAPPVPVQEQFERSKEMLFNNPRRTFEERTPGHKKNLRCRKIHSLKRQILIKEKMLEEFFLAQEQLLKELDMYQEIAVARGQEYDHLNLKMDHCQESIETLSDEIQRLQACLADEELMLEEDAMEESRQQAEQESRRSQMEAQKSDALKRKKEEKIQKNKEQRANVIGELIQTEREFCRNLKLTWQAFGLDTPEILESRGIDVNVLFGNIGDVTEVSEKFLKTLEDQVKAQASSPATQMVGRCFLQHAEHMKVVYTEYCVHNDKAEQVLERYEQVAEVQSVLQKGVEALQAQVSCFNIGSILIKPVQRILKYPLILNELIKCTENDHLDRPDLLKAATLMGEVASFINESKRRKDIVEKYKTEGDKTLTRRMSKLNLHSINKMSSRFGQKFLNTFGVDPMTRDGIFDDLEKRFSFLCKAVQTFSADSHRFREQLHDVAVSQFNVAENVADLYKERNGMLDSRVIKPLQCLLDKFLGPLKLIQKRQDKHLDYTATLQKYEKNRDPMRSKPMLDDKEKSKSTYDALNSQLVEELPKLILVATNLFAKCLTEFILLRKLFIGRVTKELLSLMDIYKRRLPLLASTSGDILEAFLVKHALVCNQLGRFSFSSKTFRPEDKRKLGPGQSSMSGPAFGQANVTPQSPGIRTFLRGKYAAAKLYQAHELYSPKDHLDIGVNPGDLVGVVQQKDPMGRRDRWFVDNGITQGFLPHRVLVAIGENEIVNSHEDLSLDSTKDPPYDDVAEDEPSLDSKPVLDENTKPIRKAPAVPRPCTLQSESNSEPVNPSQSDTPIDPGARNSDYPATDQIVQANPLKETESRHDCARDEENDTPPPPPPPSTGEVPHTPPAGDVEVVEKVKRHHSYEEIAPSEAASEPSQDLSPIYEEIHGGSRSTASTSSGSSSGAVHGNQAKGKFHYSMFDFKATDSTMLTVKRGQVIRVIHLTRGEWWYVEDREGHQGYVPHLYLKEYPIPVAAGGRASKEGKGAIDENCPSEAPTQT
eukprot:maker-scaffold1595_size34508-snap-gene-0.8 protein:Tk09498 transcript:maker-scaffold1595_size34508-snap-gene-0.8-mRNA-1 annotation:"dynamin-binding protein"